MANGSILPPDIREQIQRKQPPPVEHVRGVGSAAAENVTTAKQRDAAMGGEPNEGDAAPTPEKDEVVEAKKVCPNEACKAHLDKGWDFCARCGHDLIRHGAARRLGIEFTEEDIQDYLFKGFVIRELKILGKHTITVRSSQPKDLQEIDDLLMNGAWVKDEKGEEKVVSNFYFRQMNQLAITAASVLKMDGKPIGSTIEERLTWLSERGSALVDMVSQRVIWFNQALTEYLGKEDSFLGS